MRAIGWAGLFALTLTTPAHAAVVWTGDLETGNLDQWEYKLNEPHIDVVQDPVTQGQYSAHITLTNDATWPNGLKRVELNHQPGAARTAEGEELYFAWSFYLPAALPSSGHTIGYWESGTSYQQMFAFNANGTDLNFITQKPNYQEHWKGTGLLTPNTWHRIAIHIKWSKNEADGVIDVWYDGTQVVTGVATQTLNDDNPHFTQVGLLRGQGEFTDAPEIVIDNALEGDSLEDVEGVPAPTDGGAGSGGSAGSSSTGGSSGAATGGSGGSGGTSSGGTSSGGSSSGGTGGKKDPPPANDDGSCECAAPGGSKTSLSLLAVSLVGVGLGLQRRRARTRA